MNTSEIVLTAIAVICIGTSFVGGPIWDGFGKAFGAVALIVLGLNWYFQREAE